MPILLRLGALVGLWVFGKIRSRNPSPTADLLNKLSWPAKARLGWAVIRDKRVPVWARGLAFLPAIYLISPIDILPDFIPFLGRLDDALVFGLVVDLLVRAVPSYVLTEHLERASKGRT